jgi:hypothetical protein
MNDGYVIRQIMPCNAWYSAYKESGGFHFEPLICWALMDIKEDGLEFQRIVGVRASDAASPESYYPLPESFSGYCAPNDFEILGEKLRVGVKPRNAWGEP